MALIPNTQFDDLSLVRQGKVRDIFDTGDALLMVTTDRLSAFDVVLPDVIPDKGKVLNQISLFWFNQMESIVKNHIITTDVNEYPEEFKPYSDALEKRSMLVKKAEPLPVECIVRGYISGSFWKAYQKDTNVCGFTLPPGMIESDKFDIPLFTPSTKAELGEHDENISIARMEELVGKDEAAKIIDVSMKLYQKAADYALSRGIIIADTKFELGWYEGELILIDEVLTPDSSRFWPLDKYTPGTGQPSFDKQLLRDYLATIDWDKKAPAPALPEKILVKTGARYEEAVDK